MIRENIHHQVCEGLNLFIDFSHEKISIKYINDLFSKNLDKLLSILSDLLGLTKIELACFSFSIERINNN
jgi:hypothetical protein